ncbi:MAG: DUF456 domain-containing protein [Flavobacteriales bacterium]|jgi:uncharacterized protein YqgC (DUF456 family)|tara:strand:- start:153 stop:653 length:501 start_codon:yes stop_codon:yes gene_type:complete
MDLTIISLSGFLILIGLLGSFLPVIPGPLTSWLGLFILRFSPIIQIENSLLISSFCIALFVFLLDNIIPVLGAKKFGGGNGSMVGSSMGIILGILFLGPFGLIIGPFVGAFLGELYISKNNKESALKSAFGAFIGFLTGVFLKFIIGLAFSYYFFKILWQFRAQVF